MASQALALVLLESLPKAFVSSLQVTSQCHLSPFLSMVHTQQISLEEFLAVRQESVIELYSPALSQSSENKLLFLPHWNTFNKEVSQFSL